MAAWRLNYATNSCSIAGRSIRHDAKLPGDTLRHADNAESEQAAAHYMKQRHGSPRSSLIHACNRLTVSRDESHLRRAYHRTALRRVSSDAADPSAAPRYVLSERHITRGARHMKQRHGNPRSSLIHDHQSGCQLFEYEASNFRRRFEPSE